MRKLDTLIIKSFISPFLLTTVVATFILLIQYMLKYFDDFVGKDLGFSVFGELIFYFSLNMLSVSLPLGILVSSLMTFGNLGEHFELTAIKSAGISLLRALRPIFFFVILLSIGAFFFNNHIVPAANLKAYSLLYDIKHKKPALDIKPGVFYNGIPNYSIKVKEKLPDNKTLKDVMIYDHTAKDGNRVVILADSSRMFTILNDKYLKLELFDGNYYIEQDVKRNSVDQLHRTRYERMDLVFNLSSFDLKRTKEELFQNNRQMKNISELSRDIDSLISETVIAKTNLITNAKSFLKYHAPSVLTVDNQKPNAKKVKFKKSKKGNDEEDDEDSKEVVKEQTASFFPFDWISQQRDTTHQLHIDKVQPDLLIKSEITKLQDSLTLGSDSTELLVNVNPLDTMTLDGLDANFNLTRKKVELISRASSQARNLKVSINSSNIRLKRLATERAKYIIEKYKKFSQAFACIVMFLIGAPLGAIIKKGGLGVPVIVSVFFFIVYYVLNITNEKWAKAGLMHGEVAVWVADLILLPVGLFFLRQARIDARLFENDFYLVWIDKIKQRLTDRKNRKVAQARLAG